MWLKGKGGFSLARLKRLIRLEDYAFDRDMKNMTIDQCPFSAWEGHTFDQIFERIMTYKSKGVEADLSKAEIVLIKQDFFWIADEADFMLQMLRTFDTQISWYTVTANRDIKTVRKLLMDPILLPGFNDSGAHLTNMAFYDVNLRSLRLAQQGGDQDVSYMVKRLTRDPADVFGVAAGTIYVGDCADLILVDPDHLRDYDGEANVQRVFRAEFQHDQLVNRSDGVVPLVLIAGKVAWENNQFSEGLGNTPMGRLLKPALMSEADRQAA
jgi:N-acyl-D-aspartate/D-glutamate deacylase